MAGCIVRTEVVEDAAVLTARAWYQADGRGGDQYRAEWLQKLVLQVRYNAQAMTAFKPALTRAERLRLTGVKAALSDVEARAMTVVDCVILAVDSGGTEL